jgi:ferredoxin-NADP reductase
LARAAVLGRLGIAGRITWRLAELVELIDETPRVRSLVFDVPDWPGHRPGQHVDVRLTAEDGYQAERSYSIASTPEEARLALTVERLDDGEVSPYLVDELRAGDEIELRGPIGGYFVWTPDFGGPVLLVAGGSGVVPLMAMLRHRAASSTDAAMRLVYSSRSLDDVIYRDELGRLDAAHDGIEVVHTLTRSQPDGWTGYSRRIDAGLLGDVAWPADEQPLVYVCGPTRLVESVAAGLVELGHEPGRIRTERFGPTGG